MTITFLNYLQFGIIALVGIAVAYAQFRSGTSKVSSDTIEAYSKQVELYEKRLADNSVTMQTMSKQLGELSAANTQKDAQISEMRRILENRNPELETILKQLTHFMESVDTRLVAQSEQLATIAQASIKTEN